MDLSILPDGIIKETELYVDKSPPFSEELLNRRFTKYEWIYLTCKKDGKKLCYTRTRCGFPYKSIYHIY